MFPHTLIRSKVSLPNLDKMKFADELYIDLMFLEGSTIIHIVDTTNHFSAATFLGPSGGSYGQTVDGVWIALVQTWSTMCTGFPNPLRTDQGLVFTSESWKKLTNLNGIELRLFAYKHVVLWESVHVYMTLSEEFS